MGIYEPDHHIGMWWEDSIKTDSCQNICTSPAAETDMRLVYMLEDIPHKELTQPKDHDQETNKSSDKVLRRLAQNREAARKSRLRKKAYVQQLESSRLKLCQLEQELEQGIYIGGRLGERTLGLSGSVNSGLCWWHLSGIAAFEMQYGHWVEKQNQQTCQLRAALQAHASDFELHMLVKSGIRHYDNLFRIKAITAKSDVFYLMSGMWRTPTERFFLWIGGFRPSKLLKVLSSQLNPLTEQQMRAVTGLQQCSQQAEDALSQGLDKLQQTLSETLACDPFGTFGAKNYMGQMAIAMTKLEALVSFVNQVTYKFCRHNQFILRITFDNRLCSKCTTSSQLANQHEGCLPWVTTSNAFARLVPYGQLVLPHESA
uniref:Uncharacterized protein n=1 Tax=Musa acuminata subsp. malaccensis TaxID=214687 RepID=A0A804L214_MUSAM|nr:PREDICTED: transcription factor TGA4 isoform X2 [Musa acuminata subsp. malaccensis]